MLNKEQQIKQARLQEWLQQQKSPQRSRHSNALCNDALGVLKAAYCHLTGSNEPNMANIERVAKWLEGSKRWLFINGVPGTGKSTMLTAMKLALNYAGTKGHTGMTIRTALDLARSAQNDAASYEEAKTRSMLAIDDLGVEPAVVKTYGNEISPITELLYYRYDQRSSTIITTNMTFAQIEERYGERIADRIAEMADFVPFNNTTYRRLR